MYERKTKDVHGHGPPNINLGLFVCSFDVFLGLHDRSLLTMPRGKFMSENIPAPTRTKTSLKGALLN